MPRWLQIVLEAGQQLFKVSFRCSDLLSELRVRAAAEDDNVAHHDDGGGGALLRPRTSSMYCVGGCSAERCAKREVSVGA